MGLSDAGERRWPPLPEAHARYPRLGVREDQDQREQPDLPKDLSDEDYPTVVQR